MPRKPYSKPKRKSNSIPTTITTIIKVLIFGAIAMVVAKQELPFLTANFLKPECNIKGNISISNPANRFYHLPGMEDYESTNIDTSKGERWFCSESEAVSNGWKKAPR
ncbi:MAG: hypothetical protein ACKN9E_09880 [Microcystaceae cyanobacterium]